MSVLVAQDLHKAFGANDVIQGVNVRVGWGQRIGLVGPNGTGKTTLLRLLAGDLSPDRGKVTLARGSRVGWLRQDPVESGDRTIFGEAEAALAVTIQMEARLRAYETIVGEARDEDLDAVLEEYGALRERYEAMGGYDATRDIPRVLLSMGFRESDFARPVMLLSGGEKTRLALARMLLAGTEILLLDEPTNHLDLQATEWLEQYLQSFGGAVIVVSHDRRFLDTVVTGIAELDRGRLETYRGSFSAYWEARQTRISQADSDSRQRADEIRRLEEFWRRNKAGQARNQAWSKYKTAQRLREQTSDAPSRMATIHASFSETTRSGDEVIRIDRLSLAFEHRALVSDFSFLVTRGMRIGIIGPNGSGKSTFLKTVLGRRPPDAGNIRIGAGVRIGYFDQQGQTLDDALNLIETLQTVREISETEARNYLARFLFTGDDPYRTTAQLSGGERNRLVLAQVILAAPNLLLLDEPTNHLDIAAREALVHALQAYTGTLIVASHDRHLLDQTTLMTLEIADGNATLFDGSYSDYRQKRKTITPPVRPAEQVATTSDHTPRNSFELSRARRKAQRAVQDCEARVAEIEDFIRRIEECLSNPTPADDIVKLAYEHGEAQKELARAMTDWEGAMTTAQRLGLDT